LRLFLQDYLLGKDVLANASPKRTAPAGIGKGIALWIYDSLFILRWYCDGSRVFNRTYGYGLTFTIAASRTLWTDSSTFSAVLFIPPGIDASSYFWAASIALQSYAGYRVIDAFSIHASMINGAQIVIVRAAAGTAWHGPEGHTAIRRAVKAHPLSALADEGFLAVFRRASAGAYQTGIGKVWCRLAADLFRYRSP